MAALSASASTPARIAEAILKDEIPAPPAAMTTGANHCLGALSGSPEVATPPCVVPPWELDETSPPSSYTPSYHEGNDKQDLYGNDKDRGMRGDWSLDGNGKGYEDVQKGLDEENEEEKGLDSDSEKGSDDLDKEENDSEEEEENEWGAGEEYAMTLKKRIPLPGERNAL
ncbi:hypothetical protein HYDPIDRAFT_32851 [Hydnomerulius pinastri MD-312]|uniref:Uncharacterized protein n=1 Tax=Hydnomerulius pinastri MD-312 TaxID=994086 RepID=A0A0C9VPZ1_9AGAM|nr:hypothetical protein HYDPIDRAFT_32851 [Hydnomerulius pinastri MD-312]